MSKEKKLLFSVTAKDCEFQTFCTGGNGGQNRNAKQNGVRCIHRESGAVAEHRDGRDQYRNKQEAFGKMAKTEKFKAWHKTEVARRTGQFKAMEQAAEREVDRQMALHNLKIEEVASL